MYPFLSTGNHDYQHRLPRKIGTGCSVSPLGNEKDDSFKGSLGNIYQSFCGQDVYPGTQEKAANLLYLVTKNHAFSDGNKRIAAAVILYFPGKNGLLPRDGEKVIAAHTLVAMVVMIAEPKPEEKETIVRLVMNFPESRSITGTPANHVMMRCSGFTLRCVVS